MAERFIEHMFAAYAVVWAGIFFYLLRLTRRTRRVEADLEALRATPAGKR